MKLNIHDSPTNHAHALKLSNVTTTTSGLGYANVAQTLLSFVRKIPHLIKSFMFSI